MCATGSGAAIGPTAKPVVDMLRREHGDVGQVLGSERCYVYVRRSRQFAFNIMHERIGQPLEAHGCHAFTFWQVSRSGALLLSCSAGQADGMVEGCAVWLGMAEG